MVYWKNKVYRTFRKSIKLFKNYPIDLNLICNYLKINLMYYTNKDKELCYISKDGFSKVKNDKFYIFLNEDMCVNRKRFTLAHEISHILLKHFYNNDPVIAHSGVVDEQKEMEANMLARLILAPPQLTKNLSEKEITKNLNLSKEMAKIVINQRDIDYENLVDKVPKTYFKINI